MRCGLVEIHSKFDANQHASGVGTGHPPDPNSTVNMFTFKQVCATLPVSAFSCDPHAQAVLQRRDSPLLPQHSLGEGHEGGLLCGLQDGRQEERNEGVRGLRQSRCM